jgi:hypothetical protein
VTKEEMMRPCTLPTHWKKKEPIDACEVSGVQSYYEVGSKDKYHITINFWNGDTIKSPQIKEAKHYDCANAKKELNHIQSLIYDALNGDVLATEEVLAGLPKDASFWLCWGNQKIKARYDYDRCDEDSYKWIFESTHHDRHYMADSVYEFDGSFTVEADKDDPKTADYLRQFTLQGVRRVGNA